MSSLSLSQAAASSRRRFLGALAAVVGGSALGAPADSKAAASASNLSTVLSPSASELRALDSRLRQLFADYRQAEEDRRAAERRFYQLCPARPRELIAPTPRPYWQEEYVALEFNISMELHNRGPLAMERQVFHPEYLAADEHRFNPRSACGRWIAKRLRLSRQFEAAAAEALAQSGYAEPAERWDLLYNEVHRTATAILHIEPQTLADCAIQARAVAIATDQNDHRGYWTLVDPIGAPRILAKLAALA